MTSTWLVNSTRLLILIIVVSFTEFEKIGCEARGFDDSPSDDNYKITKPEKVEPEYKIRKSENDDREYKYLRLKNNLAVMVISEPSSEKAAAAVSINAGYSSDPPAVPGIAHFCEHMLFLGTEKFPKESGFGLFLSKHNGRTNAYTSSEYTTYHFDINANFLKEALNRFAQFFISPTFNANATNRELNAIDQEHQKNVLDDSRRVYYIERSSATPGHRYGAFGTGNLETLKTIPERDGIDIRKELLDFHKMYYSANIMKVAIIGKESIEDLEKMAVGLFSDVKNSNVELPSYAFNLPYGKDGLGVVLKIPTVREMSRLEMKFQIPDFSKYYKSKPADYLSQVIGHEGKGSLLSLLKENGWAYALWAGDRAGLKGFEFFIIGMDLTKEGLNRVHDIIGVTFQYINMLKRNGSQWMIYKEMSIIGKNRFRYKDKEHARRYVQSVAKDMFLYAPEDTLYGHYQYEDFSPKLIDSIVNAMTPRNFRYFIASQTFANQTHNKHVEYFDAEYTEEKIPEEDIQAWLNVSYNERLHLPNPNPFIPESHKLVVERVNVTEKAVPTIIKDDEMSRVWHKADDTFFIPKASIKISVYSPHASLTPSHLNHLSVFIRLVRDAMVEYGYDAQLADIRYSVRWLFTGFLVNVDGFSSKQGVLLNEIFRHITSLHINKETFLLVKQQLLESLNNWEVMVPYRQTEDLRNYVVNEKTWSGQERLKYMDDLTVESLKDYISNFMKDIYIESLYCGNIRKEHALKLQAEVESVLWKSSLRRPLLPLQHLKSREFNLRPGKDFLLERRSKLHQFSAVQIYLQVGLQDEKTNILCELFWHMIYSPIFVTLRTKEQLGYIVFSGLSRSHSVQGLRFQVQSDKSPAHVERRIDKFLKNFEKRLDNMTKTEFNNYIEAASVSKLEKPKRISYEAGTFAMEIFIKQYHFRRGQSEVAGLRNLTIPDLQKFYKQYIDPASKQRKKLAIVVLGGNATSLTRDRRKNWWTPINDVLAFKNNLPLYRQMMPYNNISLVSYKKSTDIKIDGYKKSTDIRSEF